MVKGRALLMLAIVALAMMSLLPTGPVSIASAQDYSFSVSEERVNVTVMQDGSVDIDYKFVFTNIGYLDGVDVGMPNSLYDLSTASARIVVNGHERSPRQIHDSSYVHPGIAVELDPATVSEVQGEARSLSTSTSIIHIWSTPTHRWRPGRGRSHLPGSIPNFGSGTRSAERLHHPAGRHDRLNETTWLENQPFNAAYFDSS